MRIIVKNEEENGAEPTLCLSNFLCDYCSFFFALEKFSKTFRILCMSLAVLPTKEVDSDSL